MTQNKERQFLSSFNNHVFQGDSKVVLSPDIAQSERLKPEASDVAQLQTPTAQPQLAKQNWWQNLNYRKQIALVTVALSFASASLVGGASYLFPDRFNILLWGSSAAAITAGIITSVFTRRFTNTIAQANNTIDRLSNGQSSNWGDQQLDELELLGANLSQLSGQLQVLTKEQDKINQQRQLISSLTFRTRRTAEFRCVNANGGRWC